MSGPVKALFILAFHFWKHILRKLTFSYDRGGQARFIDNYRPDRLLPVPTTAREAMPSWHRCTACGLCDAAYGHPTASVMQVVCAGVRDFSALAAIAPAAQALDDAGALERAESACPAGVPIREVVAFVASAGAR